jgi:hypothetical protein
MQVEAGLEEWERGYDWCMHLSELGRRLRSATFTNEGILAEKLEGVAAGRWMEADGHVGSMMMRWVLFPKDLNI